MSPILHVPLGWKIVPAGVARELEQRVVGCAAGTGAVFAPATYGDSARGRGQRARKPHAGEQRLRDLSAVDR